jgi:hypothetical protein
LLAFKNKIKNQNLKKKKEKEKKGKVEGLVWNIFSINTMLQ